MKVYVVMGNDFPDAVFSTEHEATEYCNQKHATTPKLGPSRTPRVHWRWYEFNLDQRQ